MSLLELSDPTASRAVLVGVSSCPATGLDPLPTVCGNVKRLAELMCRKDLWGLPEKHCRVLTQSDGKEITRDEILSSIRDALEESTDTLVVYYAGHGLIPTSDGSLFLTLPNSREGRPETALRYDGIREILNHPVTLPKTPRIVVILDCCWSGAALGDTMGDEDIPQMARVEGAYVFTSCPATQQARASSKRFPGYTAFTGELIDVIESGINRESVGDCLTMSNLYEEVRYSLWSSGLPVPQARGTNTAEKICLFRNRARMTAPAPPAATQSEDSTTITQSEDSVPGSRLAVRARRLMLEPVLLSVPSPGRPVALLASRLVTNAQFEEFLLDPANEEWRRGSSRTLVDADGRYLRHWSDGRMPPGCENHPVVNVSVLAAHAYLAWAGGQLGIPLRLPTTAEWEAAAGVGDDDGWWRDEIAAGRVNYRSTSRKLTSVGEFGQNENGFCDLLGNAWDICIADRAGTAVLCGGSYAVAEGQLAAERRKLTSSECRPDAGFRCACDMEG